MNISVVVPVYNSSDSLHLLVDEVGKVLPVVADAFELVLVNDGSPDQSWQVINELAGSHPWVRGIDLMRNYGQHNATLCGVREARYEVIITMDDDLQNPPHEIPKLLEKLTEGYDVVYGVSRKRQQAWWKTLASVFIKRAIAYVMGLQTVCDNGQLEQRERIQLHRKALWKTYHLALSDWAAENDVGLPFIPEYVEQSYHMFYLLMPNLEMRQKFIQYLRDLGIYSVFHYLPLHLSDMGKSYGGRPGDCPVTADVSDRLVRLPFHNGLTNSEQELAIEAILDFEF